MIDSFNFLATDNHISAFAIDASSGMLSMIGSSQTDPGQPQTVVVDASGRYVFVANAHPGISNANGPWYDVVEYAVGTTGELSLANLGSQQPVGESGLGLIAVVE